MKIEFFVSLLALFFTSIVARDASSPMAFLPSKKTTALTQKALSINRGGAGPLDKALTAKIFLGACAAQGSYDYLAPNKSLDIYGTTADALSTLCTGVGGGLLLMWIVTAYGVLFTDMSTLKSIGLAQIPLSISNLRNILNGDSKSIGCSIPGQLVNLAITSFASYACLSGADYATLAVKVLAVYMLLANTQCRLAPEAALKSWGLDEEKRTPVAGFATKVLGHHGICAALLIGALISDIDGYKAIGYSQIVGFFSFLYFVISGDFNKLGFDAKKAYPWIAIVATTAVTLAF